MRYFLLATLAFFSSLGQSGEKLVVETVFSNEELVVVGRPDECTQDECFLIDDDEEQIETVS